MNTNRIISIFITMLLIGIGLFLTEKLSLLPERLQVFTLVTLAVLTPVYLFKRNIPFDFKIICLLIVGYAFAGKGFAYISPKEPFYIGEIVFCCSAVAYIFRIFRGAKVAPTFAHVVIIGWMVLVGLYLLSSYPVFRLLAIRDSVIGYYAAFALFGYAIFRHNDFSKTFGNVLKIGVIAAWVSSLIITILAQAGQMAVLQKLKVFNPHPDAFIPLAAAGGIYYLLVGIQQRKLHFAGLGTIILFALIGGKTAGIFSFALIGGHCILLGRRADLLISIAVITTVLLLVMGIMIAGGVVDSRNLLADNAHLNTIGIGTSMGTEATGTTDWRIAWWTIVYEEAMDINPIFGMGLGADITSGFLEKFMRMDVLSEEAANYARYPHNIFFTVIGRMGWLGVLVFLFMVFTLYWLCVKITPRAIAASTTDDQTALLAMLVFLAGLANAFVQATYEVPYAAITHWFCLGYVMAYYQKKRQSKLPSSTPMDASSHNQDEKQVPASMLR